MKSILIGLFAALAGFLGVDSALAELSGAYAGYTSCASCHQEIVDGWRETPHAHAFETLAKQGEEKQKASGCVQCHVVAFEEEGGFVDMELTPELKGVQCESCHGPSRAHAEGDGDPDLLTQSPREDHCRACHTIGQDKNFNYAEKSKWVHTKGPEKLETGPLVTGDLSVSETRVQFGSLTEGVVARRAVTLTNTGKEPISVVNLTTN